MNASNSGKYLKYAIGEIVLVVAGIIIALQINNWNENRKDQIREQTILVQLEEEYTANLEQLEEKIGLRTRIISSGLVILAYIDAPQNVEKDSLIFHLSNIVYDPTFDPIQNDLIASGNIRLMANSKLRQLLSNWTSDIVAVQEQERINQDHAHEVILPMFNKLGLTRYVINKLWESMGDRTFLLDKNIDDSRLALVQSYDKIQVRDILANVVLEGIVSNAISYNKIGNLLSQSLKNRILELLKSELE